MKFVIDIFTKNLAIKLMALVMAVLLWASLTRTIQGVETVDINIDSLTLPGDFADDYFLTRVSPGGNFSRNPDGSFSGKLTLKFDGLKKDLKEAKSFFENSDWQSIFNYETRALADMRANKPITINLTLINNPYRGKVNLVESEPDEITLEYERAVTRTANLKLNEVVGLSPEMELAVMPTARKEKVTLKAPGSVIDALETDENGEPFVLTDTIDLSRIKIDVARQQQTIGVALDERYRTYLSEDERKVAVSFVLRPVLKRFPDMKSGDETLKTPLRIPINQVFLAFSGKITAAVNSYSWEIPELAGKTHIELPVETVESIYRRLLEEAELKSIRLMLFIDKEWPSGPKKFTLDLEFDPASLAAKYFKNGLIKYTDRIEVNVTATKRE